MEGVKLGLTKKSLDSTGDAAGVGRMNFSMKCEGPLPGTPAPAGSLFRMGFFLDGSKGRTWRSVKISSDDRPGRDDLIDFYVDSTNLDVLFGYLDGILSNPSGLDSGPVPVQVFDSSYAPAGSISFDFCVRAQLPNNVNLYGFTLKQLDQNSVVLKAVDFQLTSTDAEGIFSAIDCLIYSNAPNNPY